MDEGYNPLEKTIERSQPNTFLKENTMPAESCPVCGAIYQNNLTCESVFNEFLALEFSDAEYGAVHFLTVACYNIQHVLYSDAALIWIEQQLRDMLESGISPEQIRRRAASQTRPRQREWNITRRVGDAPQTKIAWSMSIIDVALWYQDAESYRSLVKQWARKTLDEMQPLLGRPKAGV